MEVTGISIAIAYWFLLIPIYKEGHADSTGASLCIPRKLGALSTVMDWHNIVKV